MKLKLAEGDRVVLAPFESGETDTNNVRGILVMTPHREPRQRATVEGIGGEVITVRIDGALEDGDDGLREITADQIESRIVYSQIRCGKCGSQDWRASAIPDSTEALYHCMACGWNFHHTS